MKTNVARLLIQTKPKKGKNTQEGRTRSERKSRKRGEKKYFAGENHKNHENRHCESARDAGVDAESAKAVNAEKLHWPKYPKTGSSLSSE